MAATATAKRSKSKTKAPSVSVTVAAFDDRPGAPVYRVLRDGEPATDYKPLERGDYRPHGSTPLLDATAKLIAHLDGMVGKGKVVIGALADESGSMMGNEHAVVTGINEFVAGMAEVDADPEADGKVLAVIFTDGMENASREVTAEQLRAMIRAREGEGWTFIYLGANQDAWAVGASIGATRSINYVGTAQGTSSMLRAARTLGSSYVGDQSSYVAMACASPNLSVSEAGDVTDETGGKAPEANGTDPGYGVADALKRAKEATEK